MSPALNLIFVVLVALISLGEGEEVDPGEPLYLTPLIKQGLYGQAREAALVTAHALIVSYSGFITVKEEYNSSLFFWFFPADPSYNQTESNYDEEIPLILWNDGGPALSLFFSVFGQNGPFLGNRDGLNFTLNPQSWHKRHHMIYIDQPVDVGFSHTGSDLGHVDTDEGAAEGIYKFLQQFFAMFPHLQRNPFYNAGMSYGTTYAVHTANLIQQRNLEGVEPQINLTGVMLDVPWIDAYAQIYYSDYIFNAGLISQGSREEMSGKEEEALELIDEGKYKEAFVVNEGLLETVENLTGYQPLYHVYDDQYAWADMTPWVTLNVTRNSLHVGNLPFSFFNLEKYDQMGGTMMRSSKAQLDQLLQADYPFLITVGNMDGVTNHLGVQRLLRSLDWVGASKLVDGARRIWRLEGSKGVAGYQTDSGKARLVLMRNAGHGCLFDKPAEILYLVDTFVADRVAERRKKHDEF